MRDRIYRFGTWVACLSLITANLMPPILPKALAAEPPTDPFSEPTELITQSSFVPQNGAPEDFRSSTIQTKFHENQPLELQILATNVVINEVLPDPTGITSGTEFVELFNPTTSAISISSWTISNKNAVIQTFAPGTSLPAGGFVVVSFVNQLDNAEDTITLKNSSVVQIDQIRYGLAVQANLRVPNAAKSFARRQDGNDRWFSNLNPTQGTTNGAALTLAAPSASSVKAGLDNAVGTINRFNQTTVGTTVTLPASSLSTDTVTVDLIDPTNTVKSVSAAGLAGAGTITPAVINTTSTPAFVDGLVTVRSFVADSTDIQTAYAAGTNAARDTIAPADPTAASIVAELNKNASNIINLNNLSSVKTSVTLAASSLSTDTVRVDLSDGVTTISQTAAAPQGGGTITLLTIGLQAINASALRDGSISVKATLTDAAGNPSTTITGSNAVKDTAAPAASLTINNGATVTNSSTVTLSLSASDVGSGINEMRLSHTADFAGSNFEPFVSSKTWTLLSGEGERKVYLQVRDGAGNPSAIVQATILIETDAESIQTSQLVAGAQIVRRAPVDLEVTATSPTTLTLASYRTNPGTNLPTGITGLGRYVEVGLSDQTKVTFPILIKLYYTATDLANAGITNENQLQGIAFFEQASQTWKLYSNTGVNPTDVTIDSQTFAGYLYANADHLTPLTGFADTTPPSQVGSLTATTGDGFVELSWGAVAGTSSYVLRYRPTNDSQIAYTTVILPSSQTTTKITNLANGASYEFGVAARDAAGNTSSFATLTATPAAPEPPVVSSPIVLAPRAKAAAPRQISRPAPLPTVEPTETPTPPTPVEDTKNLPDYGRLIVTLAIIAIAVGAGLAGYYGYQWWALRTTEPPSKTTAKPSREPISSPIDNQLNEPPAPPVSDQLEPPALPSTEANLVSDSVEPPEKPDQSVPPEKKADQADKTDQSPPPGGRW